MPLFPDGARARLGRRVPGAPPLGARSGRGLGRRGRHNRPGCRPSGVPGRGLPSAQTTAWFPPRSLPPRRRSAERRREIISVR